MAPSLRDLELTATPGSGGRKVAAGGQEEVSDLEDVRLLDSYDDIESRGKLEEGNYRRVQVRVTGMTCAACSNSVESALTSLKGVVSASVALLQNKADVVFDPSLIKFSWC